MKVDALVFDLGGVLIDIDLRRAFRAWAAAAGIPADAIAARFAVDEACCAHERGEIDPQRSRAGLQAHHATRPDQIAAISDALLQE
jgi:FMN phosphatase YigB (HAD superfamily)